MGTGLRIAVALALLAPMILLQGRPDLTPAWLLRDVAGVPAVIWAAMLWFALFIAAAWLPAPASANRP